MSEITSYYADWLGCSAFGSAARVLRDVEPLNFRPTDISGCVCWLDGNDSSTVNANEFGEVLSWQNKGSLGGQFDISGTQAVQYGVFQQNGLNTVSFTSNAYMTGLYTFNFQARSVFLVLRENTDLSGVNPLFTSDTTNAMEVFSLRNGVSTYFIGKHPSPIPEVAFDVSQDYLGYAALVEFVNSTDISNNWAGINGMKGNFIYDAAASGYNTSNVRYFLGSYFGGLTVASAKDYCEVIIYNTALNEPDRLQVEAYLRDKWKFTEPPPAPFTPQDINGLYLWLDASQPLSLTLSGTDVSSWSNLGLAGSIYNADCNVASAYTDTDGYTTIEFPTQTTLEAYLQLPYYTRTAFCVFENLSAMDTLTYPYLNLQSCGTAGGRQLGVNYDSNTSNYAMALCQQGYNCPASGVLPSVISTGGRNLAMWSVDSNTYLSSVCYFNGGSNLNTDTSVPNLFNTNPIYYGIGSPVSDSPAFRVAEIIEYDSQLTTAQISTVNQYLVEKWAISSFVA